MAISMARKALHWTAAGVVVGVVALVWTMTSDAETSEGNSQTQSGTGNVQGGPNSVVAGGDIVIQAQNLQSKTKGMTRAEAEQAASKYAGVDPAVGKANPYLVIDAPRHLWVRSSGTAAGRHIGAVYNETLVWADCMATTDFDPERTDDTGPVWLRIHWPTDQPNDEVKSSQPSDPYAGWVYAGYTIPAGHNGKIPTC